MPCVVTMKDTLVSEIVDLDYVTCLNGLQNTAQTGRQFASMDLLDGKNCLFNIEQILTVKEIDEDEIA